MTARSSVPFASRLARARAELATAGLDALVVTHLANIRYLTGYSGTAGIVVLTTARCTLIVDFRYAIAARWLVASHPELSRDVTLFVTEHSYDEGLLTVLKGLGGRRIGIEGAWMPVSRFTRLSAALADSAPTPLDSPNPCPVLVPTERLIERSRIVKDGDEIATLREAGKRLADAARQVVDFARPGRAELDVAADIDGLLRRLGFERPAFETIVASGPNSALPHARPGLRRLEPGDAVVLDFGGVYDGYCVDLTRTVQLGNGSSDLRRIFDAVAEAQSGAIAAVRPGVKGSTVDAVARQILERHDLAKSFGHGTGHGLGLEVHEDPRIGRPVAGQPDPVLEAGMVFTIEPGAYVEGVGGVRLEDDVLVVEGGCEVLTAQGIGG